MPGPNQPGMQKLANELRGQAFRDDFRKNPAAAMSAKGISGLPPDVIDALSDFSKGQLEYMAAVQAALSGHGYDDPVTAQMV